MPPVLLCSVQPSLHVWKIEIKTLSMQSERRSHVAEIRHVLQEILISVRTLAFTFKEQRSDSN